MREIAASPDRPTRLSPRPSITIKIAQTLDGRIATRTGQSQWITCEPARALAHELRATHDAVLVGIGTVLHDNPRLTVRLVDGPDPLRVVADTTLRIPLDCHLLTEHPERTIVVTAEDAPAERVAAVRSLGRGCIFGRRDGDRLDLADMLGAAARARDPLADGGGRLGDHHLAAAGRAGGPPRRLHRAEGARDGPRRGGDLGIRDLGQALTFRETTIRQLGPDILFDGLVDRAARDGAASD